MIEYGWHYDPNPMMSYKADLTMILGGRGIGKSYAMKDKACSMKNTTVWLSRTDTDSVKAANSFLSRFPADYRDNFELTWKTVKEDTLNEKRTKVKYAYPVLVNKYTQEPKVLFSALSVQNKGVDFGNVDRLIFDEFLIEKKPKLNYLPNEITVFLDFLQTVMRDSPKFKIFMIANEIDVINPYFSFWNIEGIDKTREFTWIKKPSILMQWVLPKEERIASYEASAFGRIVKGTPYDAYMRGERALVDYLIRTEPIPQFARYQFNLRNGDTVLAVWTSPSGYHITDQHIDTSMISFVATIHQTGYKRIYDAKLKSVIKKMVSSDQITATSKSTRTKLMEWIR